MLLAYQRRSFATFKKVSVSKPVVDIDGDEMTKVIWDWIKEKVSFSLYLTRKIAHPPLY